MRVVHAVDRHRDDPPLLFWQDLGFGVIEAVLWVSRQLGTTTVIITHNASIKEVADRMNVKFPARRRLIAFFPATSPRLRR
ncbi:hypothetical protein [Bradyrhizobium tunisiense]|uniref:hypothetical protein n=1 Tax=Bradyrhizobium tunisiense TaxID=3278709 RepID=UPI0035DA04C4